MTALQSLLKVTKLNLENFEVEKSLGWHLAIVKKINQFFDHFLDRFFYRF